MSRSKLPSLITAQATVDGLTAARDLIAPKEHWAQFASAFARDGKRCGAQDYRAVKWCAIGSLNRSTLSTRVDDHAYAHLLHAAAALFACAPTVVNDTIGHRAVIDMYDAAIEVATNVLHHVGSRGEIPIVDPETFYAAIRERWATCAAS